MLTFTKQVLDSEQNSKVMLTFTKQVLDSEENELLDIFTIESTVDFP